MWFYIVGPILGGIAAGILIQVTKAMGDLQDATQKEAADRVADENEKARNIGSLPDNSEF